MTASMFLLCAVVAVPLAVKVVMVIENRCSRQITRKPK
jgi:hypothetical protein